MRSDLSSRNAYGRQVLRLSSVLLALAVVAVPHVCKAQTRWHSGPVKNPRLRRADLVRGIKSLAARKDAQHVVVQFDGPISRGQRRQLEQEGLTILRYLGDHAYFATLAGVNTKAQALSAMQFVNGMRAIERTWKLHPTVRVGNAPTWAVVKQDRVSGATVGLYVLFHADVPLGKEAAEIVRSHGGEIRDELKSLNGLVVELPEGNIDALADEDAVQWIEWPLPRMSELNNSNRVITQADDVQAPPYDLDGSGVNVLVYDAGTALDTHVDFEGRLFVRDGATLSDHATHVAGTIGGAGVANPLYKGMAPAVTMQSYGLEVTGPGIFLYSNPGDLEADYGEAINIHGADISNNSIGTNTCNNGFPCEITGDYGVTSALIDAIVGGSLGAPFRIVWANGNERNCGDCPGEHQGGYHSTAPPACAKNHITVGALNSNDDSMTSFSSWGPTDDGRMKPDISAPGCQSNNDFKVTSCSRLSDTAYTGKCGTSMAAPTVTGLSALLLQDFRDRFPGKPDFRNSTLKVLLAHNAEDLGNFGPDYQSGYGSVRIKRTIDFMRTGLFLEDELNQSDTFTTYVHVDANDTELKVTLAWDDLPGTPNVNLALVNDLDLRVFDPFSQQHFPWTLDPLNPSAPAVRTQADHINNIEQVYVLDPVPGVWRVEIHGFSINPLGPQSFSLAGSPDLASCASQGLITLGAPGYFCETDAEILVNDCDLNLNANAVETVSVTVDSTSEPTGESVVLSETSPDTGVFVGTIPLSSISGTGVLLVAHGDSITATYVDADDGLGGQNIVLSDTVSIDCITPTIFNVQATTTAPDAALITFESDEPTYATVRYGTTCGQLDNIATQNGFLTSHTIIVYSLEAGTTYHFAIDAADPTGNTSVGSCDYSFTTCGDCNGNNQCDEFEPGGTIDDDCNGDGVPDLCDIFLNQPGDCNVNGIPDNCEDGGDIDCNNNTVIDFCDLFIGIKEDCNLNSIPDDCDITSGTSQDCTPVLHHDCCEDHQTSGCSDATIESCVCAIEPHCCATAWSAEFFCSWYAENDCGAVCGPNGIPDECELEACNGDAACSDCNINGVPDGCELGGTIEDCNGNNVPDLCDIYAAEVAGLEADCDENAVPDECETGGTIDDDCNGNGVPDLCDIFDGLLLDCNGNIIPDACDLSSQTSSDCTGNNVPDECDIASGASEDCNGNGVPDACDLASESSPDCNGNGLPDECEIGGTVGEDCDGNGVPDLCDIFNGLLPDCNGNSIADACDVSSQTSPDCNGNGVPDECDVASGASKDCDADDIPDECSGQLLVFAAEARGSRYIGVTTPFDNPVPYAIRVRGDSADPVIDCLDRFVQADGTLGATMVSQLPAEWCRVNVHGLDIIPNATYEVDLWDGSAWTFAIAVTTAEWGDVNNSGGVNVSDRFLVQKFINGLTPQSQLPNFDLVGGGPLLGSCIPDGVVDDNDLQAVINAASADPAVNGYPCPTDDDCDGEGPIDLCENNGNRDCNNNAIVDYCDVFFGTSVDCNLNGVPDDCDIATATSLDCNTNDIPDECELDACTGEPACSDCNSNGVLDGCETDCNGDGTIDACQGISLIPPTLASAPHDNRKNRFISFDPVANECSVAYRLELLDLACSVNGQKCTFADDCMACVGGSDSGIACIHNTDCASPGTCEVSGETCEEQSPPVMLGWVNEPCDANSLGGLDAPAGTLTSMVVDSLPPLRSWTESVVHIGDCKIAPAQSYAISATADGISFSDRLVIGTIPKPQNKFWGDLVGSFDGTSWSPPDGLVGINDVLAVLKFLTLDPAPHITVVDLANESPNFIINVTDLGLVLRAFVADTYPPPAFVSNQTADPSNCPFREVYTCPDGFLGVRFAEPGTPSPLTLTADSSLIMPGGTVRVDVYVDDVPDLGAYDVVLEVTGGTSGDLNLAEIVIEKFCVGGADAGELCVDGGDCASPGVCVVRADSVFGTDGNEAVDLSAGGIANALSSGGVPVVGSGYLATYVYQADPNATGDFNIAFKAGDEVTFLNNSDGALLPSTLGAAAVIGVVDCFVDGDCAAPFSCQTVACTANACVYTNDPPGTSCDDGQFCTRPDTCDGNGVCVGGAGTPCGRPPNTQCCPGGSMCVPPWLGCP